MKLSTNIKWKSGMAFETEINGHKLTIDAAPEVGGNDEGPRPKALTLVSLAGCTAMDVVSILKKMKVSFDSLNIKVESDLADEHPKTFENFHVIYEFRGKDLDESKLKKAVDLSQEKYCGVSASLKKGTDVTYEIKILD